MNLIDIFLYSTEGIFLIFVIMFAYYSLQKAKLIKGSRGHQITAVGALLLIIVSILGSVDILFFPGSGLCLVVFSAWTGALLILVYGGLLVGKSIHMAYGGSWLKMTRWYRGSINNLIGISLLVFGGIPVYLLDILRFASGQFSWYWVSRISIWAFCFANLAFAARIQCLSGPGRKEQEEEILLGDDVLTAMAYGALINTFLVAIKPFAGVISEPILEYFEHNPILFEGCKMRQDATVDFEPVVRNLKRIHKEQRIQDICAIFSALSLKIIHLYGALTSPKYAEQVLAKSYGVVREAFGDLPVFFDILRSLPKSVLKKERIALLPREELEARVQKRTRELRQAREKLQKAKDYTDNVIKSMADTLIVVNHDATIKSVNQAVLDLLGYEENELIGKPIRTILEEEEVSLFKGSGLDDDLIKKGFVQNVEKIYLSKEGRRIPMLFSGSIMRDNNSKIQGIIYVARDVTDRKKAEKKIKVYQKRLRSLASQLTIAEEEERRRIATELHDAIGQLLALCKIKLGEAEKVAASPDAHPLLEEIKDFLEEIIQYTRSLTLRLGPPIVYELGLEVALQWLAESVHEQQGIQVNLEVDSQTKPIDEDLRIFLFRAVQELLMNVTKHAKTDKAKVSLGREKENIYLSVEDRGVGFNPNILDTPSGKDIGFGLFSMRERIKYFGGEFSLQSKPGEGTQVTLAIPLKAPPAKTAGKMR